MLTLKKSADCEHQFAEEPHCQPVYLSTYECGCGETWEDEWGGCPDDECPGCGEDTTPSHSKIIAACACKHL